MNSCTDLVVLGDADPIYADLCVEQGYMPHLANPPLTTEQIMACVDGTAAS